MAKYYIANGCMFIGPDGSKVDSIKNAKRFDYNDGQSYLNKHMKGAKSWRLQNVFTHNKSFVLTNATRFVGQNSPMTNDYKLAMGFRSVADATNYIKKHPAVMKSIPNPVIIAERFETIEKPEIKAFTDEQLKTLGVEKVAVKPRVRISPARKAVIAETSGEVCAICGQPMSDWEKTLDHIKPLSRGGSNKNSNLRYVHEKCNKLKGNLLDKEMYQMTTRIDAKQAYENPWSENSQILIRAITRGVLADYKRRGFLTNFKQLEGETIWGNTD